MKYKKIVSHEEACAVLLDQWSLVNKRSSKEKDYSEDSVRVLEEHRGGFAWTGVPVVHIKSLREVNGVYWITLILPDGGEHHAPLGQYLDIYLLPASS